MFIYHYSENLYPQLQTRHITDNHRGSRIFHEELKAKLKGRMGSYNGHISFFFDKVPLSYLGDHFEGKNDFWKEGNELFEYTVDTKVLDKKIPFEVVETPEHVQWVGRINWPSNPDDAFYEKLAADEQELAKQLGYVGEDRDQLDKMIQKFTGCTESAYRNRKTTDPNFEANYQKYAAAVPHLMLYPARGIIPYLKAEQVVVGSEKRSPLKSSLENLPHFLKW